MFENYQNIFNLLLKTTLVFIALLVLTRILGKKQMSQLTFFNYVNGITMGSIAGNIITTPDKDSLGGFICLIWICILTYLTGFVNLKSGKIRSVVDGEPTLMIKKGTILQHSLHVNHLNMDDLSMPLRKQNVFSVKEVEYAILEPDGSLSVLKKPPLQEITKVDMKIQTKPIKYIPSEIIVDGKLILKNLKELNLSLEWITEELARQQVLNLEEIFYAEIQSDGSLYIDSSRKEFDK